MEAWPSTLPQLPSLSFSGEQVTGLLDSEQVLYPKRIRTYPEYDKQFTFDKVDLSQWKAFRYWWDTSLNRCAPFSAPWLTVIGFTHHFCRFPAESPWELTTKGEYFTLAISVRVIATVPVEDGTIVYGEQ